MFIKPSELRRRFRRRTTRRAKTRHRTFEVLEPKFLLAADFVFGASNETNHGFNLTLTQVGEDLQLLDTTDGSVVQAQPITDNSGAVIITGSGHDDRLEQLRTTVLQSCQKTVLPSGSDPCVLGTRTKPLPTAAGRQNLHRIGRRPVRFPLELLRIPEGLSIPSQRVAAAICFPKV